jgi:hypothetical protein
MNQLRHAKRGFRHGCPGKGNFWFIFEVDKNVMKNN